MADFLMPDYPQPFGTRKIAITTHNGPLAYAAGGETITASTFGWGTFDAAWCAGGSFNANNTGNYSPIVLVPVGQSPTTANNAVKGGAPTGSNNINILWRQGNGNEAANNTNLTSEFVRLVLIGG